MLSTQVDAAPDPMMIVVFIAGWSIRCVGTSNTSVLVAADKSLIAWGVSPTYGELVTYLFNALLYRHYA